jgi:manganese-dependent inorganic pyrophosphatase
MPNASDRYEPWDPHLTYVIGHRRPDTDAIASALGYAWFLSETGHDKIQARRAGQPAEQTAYALERFDQAPPRLLSAVATTFWHIAEPGEVVAPDSPLSAAMAQLASGEHVVPVVEGDGKPAGVVTPLGLARAYGRFLDTRNGDDGPIPHCGNIAESVPTFQARERVSDHRNALLRADIDQFLVVDENGRYVGMATQRSVLQPARARLILVDHNELSQAVAGAEEAEIVAVLDHHRLGNPPTAAPIPFVVDPVGSTSTLVAELCRGRKMTPPKGMAGLLLSGILSDTLVFRSPTAGDRDRAMASWLAGVCHVDVDLYGKELLNAAPGLGSRAAGEIVDGDRKTYEMGGVPVSIGQVEVTGMQELPQRREELLQTLADRAERENLALICLMITDVVTGRSRLLCRGEGRFVAALPFARAGDGEFDLGDMVSRKKQLVPALHSVLESTL